MRKGSRSARHVKTSHCRVSISSIPGGNCLVTPTIQPATTPRDLASVRALLRAYGAHLAAIPNGAANICIDGYEAELAALPGPYAAPFGIILLARIDDQPAACVAFKPIQPTPNEQACEMKRLWVDPHVRGHQLGRRLAEAGIAWARATGYTAMYLDTVPAAMPHANALYQALGFQPVDRYNDNRVPDVVFFRRPL